MPSRGHRVVRETAPRPYVESAPDDDYHTDTHCVDLDDCGWILENGIHTFVGHDYIIKYVRAPPDMPGFQVGTKLRQSWTEEGCPFGVGLQLLATCLIICSTR